MPMIGWLTTQQTDYAHKMYRGNNDVIEAKCGFTTVGFLKINSPPKNRKCPECLLEEVTEL